MFSFLKSKKADNYCEFCANDISEYLPYYKKFVCYEIKNSQIINNLQIEDIIDPSRIKHRMQINANMNIINITPDKPGSVYFYETYQERKEYEFCSNKCAYEFAKKKKLAMFFMDVTDLNNIRIITPDTKNINIELGNFDSLYKSSYVPSQIIDQIKFFPHILKTDRLIIREADNKDISQIESIYLDKDVMKLFDLNSEVKSVNENSIAKTIKFINENKFKYWVICPKNDSTIVIGFCIVRYSKVYWVLEFALIKKYWRYGIMSEALSEIILHCAKGGIESIFAESIMENTNVHKLLEKLGFSGTAMSFNNKVLGSTSLKMVHKLNLK